jgi:VWFA-related protein
VTEPERGPLYVLLLDVVNSEQEDQPYARQQLLKFVDSKPQGTRFAVFVLSDGLHLVQGFGSDRAQLHATLDPSHSIPHVPRIFLLAANYGRNDAATMTSVFKQIALYLDGLRGRKNIILMSRLFPLDLFPHNDARPDMRDESAEVLDALARSESSIYPIDVSGVQVFPAGSRRR